MNLDGIVKEADLLMNKVTYHENIVRMYDYMAKEFEENEIQMIDL